MHHDSDPPTLEVRTLEELAGLLRTLRRRHARQRRDSELTYRELAARAGWSHTAIAEYFTGKTLPPIDRFDVLVRLLGATPGEQGALATARDRVAEQHRRTSRRTRKPAVRQPPTDVRAVYGTLTPAAARLFRLLSVHPGPDITAPAAASLAAVPAGPLLTELTEAGLLVTPVPGRYACPDLPHAYAKRLAADSGEALEAATRRLLDHYLHTAHAADRLLDPVADPITLAASTVSPQPLADRQQALDWFTAEHPVLLATVTHASATGWHEHCGQLAWTLWTFLDRLGHWHDQITIGRAAVAAGARRADPAEQARAHRLLAHAHTRLGHFADAATELRHALDLYGIAGDLTGQAHTHYAFGHLSGQWHRPAQALDHAQQARSFYRAAGHQAGQANTLNQIGWYHAVLGNHRQALTCCRQALALHQELGDRVGQAQALDSLGYAHHSLGNQTQATTCYQHALDLHRDLGNHYYAAVTLTHLGDIHQQLGNTEPATNAWQQALTIFDDLEYAEANQLRDKLASL